MIRINDLIQIKLLDDYNQDELPNIKDKLISIIDSQEEYMNEYDFSSAMKDNIIDYEKRKKEGDKIILFVVYYNNEPVGNISIQQDSIYSEENCAEIGFWIDETKQGNGIISLSLSYIVKYCFEELKLYCIVSLYFEPNTKSENILNRNNFKRDHIILPFGGFHGKHMPIIYAKLSYDDWKNSNNS